MNRKKIILYLLLFITGTLCVVGGTIFLNKKTSLNNKVTIMLDWASNTNHTGIYVAEGKGYFQEEGLDVNIIQPSGTDPLAVVATKKADFGVSSQEGIIQARVKGLPVISIAAILQHNTSGFASFKEKNIRRPRDFEGKTFGGFGFPVEKEMVFSVVTEDHGDPQKVKVVYTGNSNFFTATKKNVDFMWIYYGWTGIEAQLRGIPINMVYLTDYSKELDYYTPLLVTHEKQDPAMVKRFMRAVSRGYEYAIRHPKKAADILLAENPGLDRKLVHQSQEWLSPRYKDDAPQWGVQRLEVWERYAMWLEKHHLLEGEFVAEKAFTNRFLPYVERRSSL